MSKNAIAGTGQYSHEVPSALGHVVLIRDGQHNGTEVYRAGSGFRFVSLDGASYETAPRCVLVRLSVPAASLSEPYGVDLESPDGLALIGLDKDDDATEFGEVLWDSAT